MNLTNQPVHQKGTSSGRPPNKAERAHWERVRELGCVVCAGIAEIHHCLTGRGGRKDHMKVIPLCNAHHTGYLEIHHLGRKKWQVMFGTEQEHLENVRRALNAH